MKYEKYNTGNEAKRGYIAEIEMVEMGVVEESHSRWACLVSNADGLVRFFQYFNS